MKRIGLLISTLKRGGAERVVSHLTRILSDTYHVHLILFEDTYLEYSYAGTLHTLAVPAEEGGSLRKITQILKRAKRLKALIKQEKLDCVISFMDNANFVNVLAKAPGCRKILSVRNYHARIQRPDLMKRVFEFFKKRIYRRADGIVAVSEVIRREFQEQYKIPEEKICAIYNPYHLEEIRQMGAIPLTGEEQAFFAGNFVFVNVGRICYQKGGWHLLKAFSLVQKTCPNARLVMVGRDGSNEKMEELAKQLGVGDKVLFTGSVNNPYQYMKNADCYVLSSLFEGFPNTMVEAMACGCPMIAADCKSGPREILYEKPDLDAALAQTTEADYGILVPELEEEVNWDPNEITQGEEQLAAAMQEMIRDPQKREELARRAMERSRVFDYDAAKKAFCQVIKGR